MEAGSLSRTAWTGLTDAQLLAQCEVDTYRASGPGGQKRNKTSSAVRLRHGPSGLIVIAEESRSQHENKAKALRRLHAAFWLELREPILDIAVDWNARPKSASFLPTAAVLLDALELAAGSVRDAAEMVGTTTSPFVDFLSQDDKAWRATNAIRTRHSKTPLRA